MATQFIANHLSLNDLFLLPPIFLHFFRRRRSQRNRILWGSKESHSLSIPFFSDRSGIEKSHKINQITSLNKLTGLKYGHESLKILRDNKCKGLVGQRRKGERLGSFSDKLRRLLRRKLRSFVARDVKFFPIGVCHFENGNALTWQ